MRIAGPRAPILLQIVAALVLAAATGIAMLRAGPVAASVALYALYALLAVACFALLAVVMASQVSPCGGSISNCIELLPLADAAG